MSDNSNHTADRLVHIPERELTKLRAERDALRAALVQMLNRYDFGDDASDDERSIYEQARAALQGGAK